MNAYKQQINSTDLLCLKGPLQPLLCFLLQNNKPVSQCIAKIEEEVK